MKKQPAINWTVKEIEAEVRRMDPHCRAPELRAATILLASLCVGTQVQALTAFTAYPTRQVEPVVRAAFKNGIFTMNNRVAGAHWFKKDGALSLWLDVACCLGFLQKVPA